MKLTFKPPSRLASMTLLTKTLVEDKTFRWTIVRLIRCFRMRILICLQLQVIYKIRAKKQFMMSAPQVACNCPVVLFNKKKMEKPSTPSSFRLKSSLRRQIILHLQAVTMQILEWTTSNKMVEHKETNLHILIIRNRTPLSRQLVVVLVSLTKKKVNRLTQ